MCQRTLVTTLIRYLFVEKFNDWWRNHVLTKNQIWVATTPYQSLSLFIAMFRKIPHTREEFSWLILPSQAITHLSHPRWSSIPKYGIQISAPKQALSVWISWRTSGPQPSQSELPWFPCRHCFVPQSQMIPKTQRLPDNTSQIGNYMSWLPSSGSKIMLKKWILRVKSKN